MAKSILKRNEFNDQINFDFVKLVNNLSVHQEALVERELSSEDLAFEAKMQDRHRELEEKFKGEEARLKEDLEKERIELVESAQKEAQALLENAKKQMEEREREANEKVTAMLEEANREKEAILATAQAEKERLEAEAKAKTEEVHEEAQAEGYEKGFDEAYEKAEEHLDELFGNIQSIADHLLARRQQILRDSQGQLTAVLLSAMRKIVYKITEMEEDLVVKTLQEAMLRVTTQSDIILRINPADFALVQEWTPKLQERFKNLKSIKVFEDSTVEKGGCLVETDFGEIDARISTQISRLEERILEINPVLAL